MPHRANLANIVQFTHIMQILRNKYACYAKVMLNMQQTLKNIQFHCKLCCLHYCSPQLCWWIWDLQTHNQSCQCMTCLDPGNWIARIRHLDNKEVTLAGIGFGGGEIPGSWTNAKSWLSTKNLGSSKIKVAKVSFDLTTSRLWASHAPTAPLRCKLVKFVEYIPYFVHWGEKIIGLRPLSQPVLTTTHEQKETRIGRVQGSEG